MRFSFNITDNIEFYDGKFLMIAGPCAVESEEQIVKTAKFLSKLGVKVLRGGAYKPRTSPDSFQGLGKEGLLLSIDVPIRKPEKFSLYRGGMSV